jgi:hypothetical protein
MNDLTVCMWPTGGPTPYARNSRKIPERADHLRVSSGSTLGQGMRFFLTLLALAAGLVMGLWAQYTPPPSGGSSSVSVNPPITGTGLKGDPINCTVASAAGAGCVSTSSYTAFQVRSVGAGFDGGGAALVTGKAVYVTMPPACTIVGYNITVDTGTISFDVWKIATGTAVPTVANTILTGGYLALASGTALHSASTSLFTTTTSAANDIYGFEIQAVSGATQAGIVLQCNTI